MTFDLPSELFEEWSREEIRHIRTFVACVDRFPNFRLHLAYALLGSAIATVDVCGGDAEGFLRTLRMRAAKVSASSPPDGRPS